MEHVEWLGPYRYGWDENCFPLGRDSMALAAFCTVRPRWRVCDFGCGAGALLALLLGREPTVKASGVELSAHAADWARRNLPRVPITTGDMTDRGRLPPAGSCDLVISNPPYFAADSGGNGGAARMEHSCTLRGLCAAAAYTLKNGGRFALAYRPERLCDLMCSLRAVDLEPKRMQMLSVPGKPPSALLLEAVRQGRPGLDVLPDEGQGS